MIYIELSQVIKTLYIAFTEINICGDEMSGTGERQLSQKVSKTPRVDNFFLGGRVILVFHTLTVSVFKIGVLVKRIGGKRLTFLNGGEEGH